MDQKAMKETCTNVAFAQGSAIRGERVATQFRKMHKIAVVHGTSTHNIQQTKLEGSVICVIERPLNHLTDVTPRQN